MAITLLNYYLTVLYGLAILKHLEILFTSECSMKLYSQYIVFNFHYARCLDFNVVTILWNFHVFQVKNFKDYVDLYVKNVQKDGERLKVVHEVFNKRWEICVTVSENGFQQASFVNSIATTKVCSCVLLKKSRLKGQNWRLCHHCKQVNVICCWVVWRELTLEWYSLNTWQLN